ncbi:glutamine-hydrolyzing GMP synthase [Patescibacteria group bacterium]|nr:glutamine-hydrolyzing GMP synthase [Patescibacteria group bacterium]
MIIIVDFGSQTTHLISRRIKELGAPCKVIVPENIKEINKKETKGIILSGGPASVYAKGAPSIDPEIFSFNIPILGICYGFQLMAKLLGGKVIAGKREYGPAGLKISNFKFQILNGLPKKLVVWMSHGDEIVELPKGFTTIGSTEHFPFAFVNNLKKKIIGVQFHPEVEHTEFGSTVLKNFIEICNIKTAEHFIDTEEIEKNIKKIAGESYVIGAVSGGVDSTVASTLAANAIGKKFIPIYVDNGLMRAGTKEHLKKIFDHIGINLRVIDTKKETLSKLKGVTSPEKKRMLIGKSYILVFEKEMKRLIKQGKNVEFLLQGTIYSDVIESKGTKHADKIKSHHNVGGLPKNMKLKILEPLRHLYKDEVRNLGRKLGLPEDFVRKQPFPGPGYAVRIRGEVTAERLRREKQADAIVLEELEKTGVLQDVFLSFPVMTGAFSTAVKGDGRQFGEVIALRIIESKDIMTTTWARLPYDLLQKISSRIVNEVPGISRVVYDITTKPPATMEWE